MRLKTRLFAVFVTAAAMANAGLIIPEADNFKPLTTLKSIICMQDTSTPKEPYDVNLDGKVDLFDFMRTKRDYIILLERYPGTSESSSAAETTVTDIVTEPSETTSVCDTSEAVVTTVTAAESQDPSAVSSDNVSETSVSTAFQTTSAVTDETSVLITSPVTTTTDVQSTSHTESQTTSQTTVSASEISETTVTQPSETPHSEKYTSQAVPSRSEIPSRKMLSNIKPVKQAPELPTGCEATGLTMLINYYGYDAGKMEIATKYMPSSPVYYSNGRLYGPDYNYTFAGDPTKDGLSYGCYIPCMMTTVNNYFEAVGSPYRTRDLSGTELEDLFPYIAAETPVALIMTPELVTPRTGDTWYTPDGRAMTWQKGHHCMVLVGYDLEKNLVYCADPMMIKGVVSWDIDWFRSIYDQKGKHAMIVDTGNYGVPQRDLSLGDSVNYIGNFYSRSDEEGSPVFFPYDTYKITYIYPENSGQRFGVCLSDKGWVDYNVLKVNIPLYNSDLNKDPEDGPGEGVRNIINCMSSKYMNVDYGIDEDGTNIYQWSKDSSNEQKFVLKKYADGYRICAYCSSGGNGRVVSADKPQDGSNVHLYQILSDDTQVFEFKYISGGKYAIVLKAYPDLALSVSDSSNGSSSGTQKYSAGNVFISKYTGSSSQLWEVR